MCAKSLQLCPNLCDPMDCSPPGSSVHGILQARILEWASVPFSRGSSPPRDQTCLSCGCYIAGGLFSTEPTGEPSSPYTSSLNRLCVCAWSVAQSYPTLCDPMDCSPPGSSVCGILQARILEWVAISSSRGSSQRRDQTCVSCIAGRFFIAEPSGKPQVG